MIYEARAEKRHDRSIYTMILTKGIRLILPVTARLTPAIEATSAWLSLEGMAKIHARIDTLITAKRDALTAGTGSLVRSATSKIALAIGMPIKRLIHSPARLQTADSTHALFMLRAFVATAVAMEFGASVNPFRNVRAQSNKIGKIIKLLSTEAEFGMVLSQIRMSKHPKNTSLGEV